MIFFPIILYMRKKNSSKQNVNMEYNKWEREKAKEIKRITFGLKIEENVRKIENVFRIKVMKVIFFLT